MLLNLPSLRHVRETLLIFTFLSSLRCLSSQYGQAMIFFGQSLSRCFCKNLFWNFAPQSFMQRISAYSQFEFTWSCEHKQQYHFKTISIRWCCRQEGKMIVVWSQTFYINLYRRSQNKNSVGFNERTRGGEGVSDPVLSRSPRVHGPSLDLWKKWLNDSDKESQICPK